MPTIFPELRFIRLADAWIEDSRDPGQWGGEAADKRVYRRYKLKWAPAATLDFWYRGRPISPMAGQFFLGVLSVPRSLQLPELEPVEEVLAMIAEALKPGVYSPRYEIVSAEVGPLHGRNVLQVRWQDLKAKRKFMSVYIATPDDPCIVHEIHFSTPAESFAEHENFAIETLRTIQWDGFAPPPLSSTSS